MNEKQSWNITAIFLLLLFGLTIASILCPKRKFSEMENRTLAQLPAVSAESVFSGRFESEYETYLTDQFVLRDKWIALRTAAERASLKQEVHDVYFAKDEYLIEKHAGVFTSDQAKANVNFMHTFAGKYVPRLGEAHVSFMFVPNAVKILESKLPPLAAPYDEAVYLSQLKSVLPEGTWFDAGQVLSSHADEQIYYRSDHHWTTLGAFYVFKAWAAQQGLGEVSENDYIVTRVTDSFSGTLASKIGIATRPDSIEIYEPKDPVDYVLTYNRTEDVRSSVYQPYVLEGKDKYAYFFGGNYGFIQAKTELNTGRRLLVIKDSYAHCFAPFLFSYYDEVDLLDLRYYNSSLEDLITQEGYTDILVLQNAAGFAEDSSMSKLLM